MRYHEYFKNCLNEKSTFLCVGIDPDPEKIPTQFKKNPDGIYHFVQEVINVTKDITPAYKFNLAFFELWGWKGWQILEKIIDNMPKNILLIGDAKRSDIGNSSRFYAKSLFEILGFHAVTVSPYLGSDSILPFIADESKGAFVLCVTSNPSGREIQNHGSKQPLYLKVASMVYDLDTSKNLGLVVGATKPDQLMELREAFFSLPFLIPGIGKQGGSTDTAVLVCRALGLGLINVSRSIIFAEKGDFPENVRSAAQKYADLFKK
jgi:orotidine-5'-phosphate decarboxylase